MDSKLNNFFRQKLKIRSGKLLVLLDFIMLTKSLWSFDVIITANIKTAQLIALFRRIFKKLLRSRNAKHIILELMLDEPNPSVRWRLKCKFQRFLFSSVDKIIVSSSDEVSIYSKRLNLPESHFIFIPFHTNIIEPMLLQYPKRYILSAGKTGRDYYTLVEAARKIPLQFVMISDYESAQGIDLPKNVDLLIDIPRKDYLKLLQECYFVVVPLHTLVKSTGQVVILEAMAYGKPVIATDAVGTRDYVYPEFNGFLVPPYDPSSLKKFIHKLASDVYLHSKISQNSLDFVLKNCTFDIYM